MSEKRFLSFIFIEGLLLTILALCVLILPKLTSLSFGVMLSVAFITYGLYKIIVSFINKIYLSNILWSIFLGVYILTIGILLLLVPKISLLWLIALIGVFFLLESISTAAFVSQTRNMFNSINCKAFAGFILFIAGLIIILGLPVMSFWAVVMLSGIALLTKGMAKITLALANKNNYNI
ncbi:DUF308 domain-containing protein [bacterium]|nr:DUF308 domain-containing protein [bacterium]